MAEPLKNQFGVEVPRRIAGMIGAVSTAFDQADFVRDCLDGYEALELMPRGRRIAAMLRRHLPPDYPEAVEILLASIGPVMAETEGAGMAPFLYMPHVFFVAEHGLGHFEESMAAQHALTQRFTAEFSIRPYLMRHPEATLTRLREWTTDASPHVRRLVSEGTRPRLPWAPRLPDFQRDPSPVLALLELLKDDPELYVRRSVANNLNDIGKDHPDILAATAKRWLAGASPERQWLVRHALRSAVKRGAPGALAAMGAGAPAQAVVQDAKITPALAVIGGAIQIAFMLTSTAMRSQRIVVDFQIHFVKANGSVSPKVFKLKMVDLARGETQSFSKRVSLAEMTTRKHYAGVHRVDVLLNGEAVPLGAFQLSPSNR